MPQDKLLTKTFFGVLFTALVLLMMILLVIQRPHITGVRVPYAVALLRRSVKAHENGVYNGYFSRG